MMQNRPDVEIHPWTAGDRWWIKVDHALTTQSLSFFIVLHTYTATSKPTRHWIYIYVEYSYLNTERKESRFDIPQQNVHLSELPFYQFTYHAFSPVCFSFSFCVSNVHMDERDSNLLVWVIKTGVGVLPKMGQPYSRRIFLVLGWSLCSGRVWTR